jgi:Tfp pilus assembly protein PilF
MRKPLIALIIIMILTLVVFLPPVTPSDKRNVDGSASNTSLDIGVSYLNKSDYEMAVFHLSKAVQEDPGNWLPHHWLGTAYVYLRRYQDAITQLKEANRLKEAEGNYTWLGVAYFNLSKRQTG